LASADLWSPNSIRSGVAQAIAVPYLAVRFTTVAALEAVFLSIVT
jgi:hypothetical protein